METKDKQQVSTSTPYGATYADNVFSEAQNIYGKGGNQSWGGAALAGLNPTTKGALQDTMNLSRQAVPGLAEAQRFNTGMIANNGMTPELNGVAKGIRGSMDQSSRYLTPFASGQYQEDPRLAQMLETNANRAVNGAATRFGGGRYGSNAIGTGVGTAVADANNTTMLQSNENSRNRQLQATGMLSGIQMQGNGLLGNMYDQGLGRSSQAISRIPMLNEQRYDGASRRAGVGDFYQNRTQTERDAEIARFEANQPWNKLEPYRNIVQGLGGLGKTTTTPKAGASGAQRVIGGAASGAAMGSMFGPWGSAIGGVGGGLLGAFG